MYLASLRILNQDCAVDISQPSVGTACRSRTGRGFMSSAVNTIKSLYKLWPAIHQAESEHTHSVWLSTPTKEASSDWYIVPHSIDLKFIPRIIYP